MVVTRRNFLALAAAGTPARLVLALHRITDVRAQCSPAVWKNFWSTIWPEAFRDFQRAGIQLQATDAVGEIKRTAADRPVLTGIQRGVINLMLTDHVPINWDRGRAVAGVSALYEGTPVCMIALRYAHGHEAPFLSVNTVVHELLHVLLRDIYVRGPKWYKVSQHEARIDWYATRLWLFHDGSEIRKHLTSPPQPSAQTSGRISA